MYAVVTVGDDDAGAAVDEDGARALRAASIKSATGAKSRSPSLDSGSRRRARRVAQRKRRQPALVAR